MSACVYRMYDADGVLLYVGMSTQTLMRMKAHQSLRDWWADVANIAVEHHATRDLALTAEEVALASENPKYTRTNAQNSSRAHTRHRPNQEGAHARGEKCSFSACIRCRVLIADEVLNGGLRDVLIDLWLKNGLGAKKVAKELAGMGCRRMTGDAVTWALSHYGLTSREVAS